MSDWKQATLTLKFPIDVDGTLRSTVMVREPDLNGLEAIEELDLTNDSRVQRDENGKPATDAKGRKLYRDPSIREVRKVAAIMSDLPDEALGRMHREDFTALAGLVFPLLNGPESEDEQAQALSTTKA